MISMDYAADGRGGASPALAVSRSSIMPEANRLGRKIVQGKCGVSADRGSGHMVL